MIKTFGEAKLFFARSFTPGQQTILGIHLQFFTAGKKIARYTNSFAV